MKSGIELIILPDAEEDMADILQYTLDAWGDEQEATYRSVLWGAFQRIQQFPDIGRQRPDLRPGIQELHLTHHTIVYLREPARVTILRIINPRQQR